MTVRLRRPHEYDKLYGRMDCERNYRVTDNRRPYNTRVASQNARAIVTAYSYVRPSAVFPFLTE